jgi:phosphatidylglycerol---prolipoprotein diacylglyceryl transferase
LAGGGNGLLGDGQTIMGVIRFEELGLSAELFRIGDFALRYYGLAYLFGIFIGWWLIKCMLIRSMPPMTTGQVDDFIIWATFGIVLGGRMGYVLFYSPDGYLDNPFNAFAVWKGGMAFHGGVIGVTLAALTFAWKNKLHWLRLCDFVACVYPIGHLFGRLANFVNGELWGRPTDGSWGIIFPSAGPEPRHPSQLYEAGLEAIVPMLILTWLFWRSDSRLFPGRLTAAFCITMGAGRFIAEFYREPDRDLGFLSSGLTMGQTFTIPMFVIGLVLLWHSGRSRARADIGLQGEASI